MNRENRFNNNDGSSSAHRKLSAEKIKEIYIQNVANDETKPLKIGMNKTVKDLKNKLKNCLI